MTDQPPRGTRAEQEELRRRGVRPLPEPDELTRPYWEAARRGELRVQRCTDCGEHRHPPSESCGTCDSSASDWDLLPGTGRVFSFVVDHRLMVPGFDEPYVVAQVRPDGASSDLVRLVTNLRGCAIEDVEVGMPVRIVFEDRGEVTLPQFEPA